MHTPVDILVTKRLTLRPPLEVDTDAIAAHLQDTEVARNLSSVPSPYTQDDARKWIAAVNALPDALHYTIHKNALVGVISVRSVARGDGPTVPDLGYWLARPFWGDGLMTEAARAVLAQAFRRLDCSSIHSGAFADNLASLRVLEKLGFKPTSEKLIAHCPTRGEDVEAHRCKLERVDFERKFGTLETKEAA